MKRNIKTNISQKKSLASSFVICTQRPEISSLEITLSGKHWLQNKNSLFWKCKKKKKKDSIEKNYCRKKRKKEIEGYKIWTQIEKGDFDTIKTEEKRNKNWEKPDNISHEIEKIESLSQLTKFENNIKIIF